MKLFIDESLSPQLAIRLNATDRHDAVHPLHIGRRGEPDHRVVIRCMEEDRLIVTQNARDFLRLVSALELHPGLIVLPPIERELSWTLLQAAIAFLETRGNPADEMVNHVLEIDLAGTVAFSPLPRMG